MSLKAIAFGAGRINRRSFWLWHSLLLAAGLVASVGLVAAFGMRNDAVAPRLMFVFVWIVLDWLWMAQTVRRLHDFGRGAAWAVAPQLLWLGLIGVALLLPMLALAQPPALTRPGLLAGATATTIGLAALIWLGLKRGDHAANQFGPPTWIRHPDPPGMHPGEEPLPNAKAPPK